MGTPSAGGPAVARSSASCSKRRLRAEGHRLGRGAAPCAASPATSCARSLTVSSALCVAAATCAVALAPSWMSTVLSGCAGFVVPRLVSGGRQLQIAVHVKPVGRRRKESAEDSAILTPTDMREGPEGWTDYTRYALGMEDDSEADQSTGGVKPINYMEKFDVVQRKRAIGIDFGPMFTGLAMSLGSVNSLPLGTLETGTDWKETAIKICQIASTRRAEEIVLGLPLEKDGTEGGIAVLVRHFAQIVSDTALLLLGGDVGIYLWDERFSTAYAAMRLVSRPQMESGAFKSWLDGQRGLDYSSKALLDSEAARSILEHWLEGDPSLGKLNKEKSERVPPTKEAVRAYLLWKKNPLSRVKQRPVEPQGMGMEAFEWWDTNQESQRDDYDFLMEQRENYTKIMKAQDWFGHKEFEINKKKFAGRKNSARERRAMRKNKQDDTELRKNLQSSMDKQKLPPSSMPQM